MSSAQTFSTGDLRAGSQDYKRDSESKHKWERGQTWNSGRLPPAHGRPVRLSPKIRQSNKELGTHQAKTAQRHDILEVQNDSSCDEDVIEPSAAPEPDVDIAYSFDAARGPSHGSQVLGLAIEKAMERYESTVTDKIVKDEYEVLDSDGEPIPGKSSKKGTKNLAMKDEDDYEFV